MAAEVEVGVRLGISSTDNVFLDPTPDEVDDIVFTASPWITFDHESPNLDANLRYRFDWFKYDEFDTTSTYHMGEASIIGKAWDENLAVELGALQMQVLKQPDEGTVPGRLPLSGSFIDRSELYVRPQLDLSLGRTVTLFADYRYSEGKFDDPGVQDDNNHDARVSIENYNAGQGLTWALRYNMRKTEYELSNEFEYRQASAELGFWANRTLRLFGVSGVESAWDEPFDPELEDPFWEVGFAHKSGDNVSAEFAGGERSFGSSWRGMLELEFERGSTSLNYNESPSTTGFDNSGGRQSVINPDDIDEFLSEPGQSERYISKTMRWDLSLDFRRSGLQIVFFDNDRSGRLLADGTPLEDESQRGVRANFKWEAGTRSKITLSGAQFRTESGSDGRAEFRNLRLNLGYDLGARTEISAEYAYSEQRPRGGASTSRDYENNVVSVYFTFTTQ